MSLILFTVRCRVWLTPIVDIYARFRVQQDYYRPSDVKKWKRGSEWTPVLMCVGLELVFHAHEFFQPVNVVVTFLDVGIRQKFLV